MRKLASIQIIKNISDIQDSHSLSKCEVLGWQCVVKKEEFKIGDLCCYLEIDSIVPTIPYFDFMAPRKYRVKTIKLRKQISQGLIIPLNDIPIIREQVNSQVILKTIEEGIDLTDYLKIKKYESPSDKEQNQGIHKKKHNWFIKFMTRFSWYRKLTHTKSKSFPEWISKTDEPRLQNMPSILKDDGDWIVSEKVDGCSSTFWYKHKLFYGEFGICSRTVRKFEHDNSNWSRCAKQFKIKEKLKSYGKNIAIQGEIISDKIQGGKYRNGKTVEKPFDLYIFNVFNIDEKRYLSYYEMKDFCSQTGLKMVPTIYESTKLLPTVKEMLEMADGKSVLADTLREGLVWRKHDQSVSFKVVSNKFLLKDKGE